MALQLLQNYNSHHIWTFWDDGSCNLATATEPHRLCTTAVPIQECCTTCGPPAADPPQQCQQQTPPQQCQQQISHSSASSTDVLSYSAPITMKDTVLIVLSSLYFVVEDTIAYRSLLLNLPNCGKMSKQKRISALKDVIKYFTTFFASKIFFLFPPLKPRCV